MKVLVVLEAVFYRTPDGHVWTSGVFTHSFFSRYLKAFSHVVVAARVQSVTTVPTDHQVLDHPDISFAAIPWYRGLFGYLRVRRKVRSALRAALTMADAVILRVPSPLAGRLHPWLRRDGRPFAVQAVGDPWQVFAPGVIRHALRPLIRMRLTTEMQRQCRDACAATYVTNRTLQQRYPAAQGASSYSYSDIELADSSFVDQPRSFRSPPALLRVVCVGTMSQNYKGQDLLLRAVAGCHHAGGPRMEVSLVGDGVKRTELEELCAQLGLNDNVRFVGHLAERGAVLTELDRADAFILPSRTEGLPRAVIEAMARGLPCLSTRVGGIPELLDDDALVPPDDHVALEQAIRIRLTDMTWMAAASARNLAVARTYHQDLLRERREQFYQAVRDATARWLAAR